MIYTHVLNRGGKRSAESAGRMSGKGRRAKEENVFGHCPVLSPGEAGFTFIWGLIQGALPLAILFHAFSVNGYVEMCVLVHIERPAVWFGRQIGARGILQDLVQLQNICLEVCVFRQSA